MKERRGCFLCHALGVKEVQKKKRIMFYCGLCRKISQRFIELSGNTKVRRTKKGLMHYSAGALIEKDGKYLVSKRTHYPYLYTVIGGHVDRGETMTQALIREVKEETGLSIIDKKLIFRGCLSFDSCTRGVDIHFWNLFLVRTKGMLKINKSESVSLHWLTKRQMARLHFTPPVTYIFKRLNFFFQEK